MFYTQNSKTTLTPIDKTRYLIALITPLTRSEYLFVPSLTQQINDGCINICQVPRQQRKHVCKAVVFDQDPIDKQLTQTTWGEHTMVIITPLVNKMFNIAFVVLTTNRMETSKEYNVQFQYKITKININDGG